MLQMGSGTTDDGANIVSHYVTPTYAPTNLYVNSYFHHLFMTTEQSDATLETVFYVNGSGVENALGDKAMNETTGLQSFKLPFSFSGIQQGKAISFKWTIDSASDWRILYANLDYESDIYAP